MDFGCDALTDIYEGYFNLKFAFNAYYVTDRRNSVIIKPNKNQDVFKIIHHEQDQVQLELHTSIPFKARNKTVWFP